MSQPVETQPERTGYPTAAGVMTIVSACLLAVANLALIFSYAISIFWVLLPGFAVSVVFNILEMLGGVQALVRKHLLFAVFGTSVLIAGSTSYTTSTLANLALALTNRGNFTISVAAGLFIAISPVVLVLSVLSLIFLARSRHEFS